MEGILIGGPDAERLPLNQSLDATLESVGACRIRIGERSNAGAQARFEAPDAALTEKIEDRLWAIHDENTEFVTRAMEAGTALTRIFEERRRQRRHLDRRHVRRPIMSRSPAPIRCSTAPEFWTGRIARCRRFRRRSSPRTRAWCSA